MIAIKQGSAKELAAAIRTGTRSNTIAPVALASACNWGVYSTPDSRELVAALRDENKNLIKGMQELKEDAIVPCADEPQDVVIAPKDSLSRIQKVRAVQAYLHGRLAEQKKQSEITRSGLTKAEQQQIIDIGIPGKLMATAVRVAYTESMEVAFAREDLDVLETIRADMDSKYPAKAK